MPIPELDPMAAADVAFTAERIVAEIHRQLGDMPAPIPVEEIALALGIAEIRQEVLSSFEGALVTDPERSSGEMLVNRSSGAFRRRFTVAHELGHFLCAWHEQPDERGFLCTGDDMRSWAGKDQHGRQEAEANRFAIELLAPVQLLVPYLKRLPDLEHVLQLSRRLELSKEAAARRYVSLHRKSIAIIFCEGGCYKYAERGVDFPFLPFHRGEQLPPLPRIRGAETMSDMNEVDPEAWFKKRVAGELGVQVLAQQQGRAIVLLHLAPEPCDQDPDS